MTYTIDFCVLSIMYLGITAFFYRKQPKVPGIRNRVFGAMLLCGIIFIALDIATALIDPIAGAFPIALVYAVNIMFLLSVQATVLLFFFYTAILAGAYATAKKYLPFILIPFFAALIVIIAAPFTRLGAFYLDERHVYNQGALHIALYAISALYLLGGLCVVLARRKALRPAKLFTVLTFLAASFTAMLVQFNYPYLLVNSMANAFSLILIYHVLESPTSHIDALTGALNRKALPVTLSDAFEQGQRCTLVLFLLKTFWLVNHSIGVRNADLYLIRLAEHFRNSFPNSYIIRLSGDAFAVMFTGVPAMNEAALSEMRISIPAELTAGSVRIKPDISIVCINSEEAKSASDMLTLTEAALDMHRAGELDNDTLMTGGISQSVRREALLLSALESALAKGGVEVYYQPIHDGMGELVSLEALVRIRDAETGFLPTQEAVELAERKGLIDKLGRAVLSKVCELLSERPDMFEGLDHVGVNLSALQCVRDDLPETIAEVTAEYGVDAQLLAFEVTETAFASMHSVSRNMKKLTDAGFRFLLDDFGKGYSNFAHISTLPFHCVKLDRGILWDAEKGYEEMRFLMGVIKMLKTMELKIVCEGVETREQAELVSMLGVDMLQGYYFSKPKSVGELTEYIAKARAKRCITT